MANDDQRPVLIKDSDEGLVINKVMLRSFLVVVNALNLS